MLEVTFIFGDSLMPVDISIETIITEEAITKKGSFKTISSEELERILETNGVTPQKDISISESQQGLELTRYVETEEDNVETLGTSGVLNLSVDYNDNILEKFKFFFGDWIKENISDFSDLEEFEFEFHLEGEEE